MIRHICISTSQIGTSTSNTYNYNYNVQYSAWQKYIYQAFSYFLHISTKVSVFCISRVFTQYPEAQEKFKDFRGLTIEEVQVHKKLRAHALSVVYALKSFIDNLDDTETMEQLVRKIARSHYERTVTAEQIQVNI